MKGPPHYLGHRKRLRERFNRDPESLLDYELLELLLFYCHPRKDTKPLAKEMLHRCGSLKGIFLAPEEKIKEIPGAGEATALFFKAIREFFSRTEREELFSRRGLRSPLEVFNAFYPRIGPEKKESFWVVLLDTKNRPISIEKICEGTVDRATVYPREVFEKALTKGACGIILLHNHPGGDPSPSREDILLTREIEKIGEALGIRVLDHLVIAADSFVSLREMGELSQI